MTVQIQRPKDLPASSTPIADTHVIPVDQLDNGVKKMTFAQLRSGVTGSATGLTSDATSPEGRIIGKPGYWHLLDDGTNLELWLKRTGVDTATGWLLAIKLA
jgi:hypothetical protein